MFCRKISAIFIALVYCVHADELCNEQADGECSVDGLPATVSLVQANTLLSRGQLGQQAEGTAASDRDLLNTRGQKATMKSEEGSDSATRWDIWDALDFDNSMHVYIHHMEKKWPPKGMDFVTDQDRDLTIWLAKEVNKDKWNKKGKNPYGVNEYEARMLLTCLKAHLTFNESVDLLLGIHNGTRQEGWVMQNVFNAVEDEVSFAEVNASRSNLTFLITYLQDPEQLPLFKKHFDMALPVGTSIKHAVGVRDNATRMANLHEMLDSIDPENPMDDHNQTIMTIPAMTLVLKGMHTMSYEKAMDITAKLFANEENVERVAAYIDQALGANTDYNTIFRLRHKKKEPDHSDYGPIVIGCTIGVGALFLLYLMMYRKP